MPARPEKKKQKSISKERADTGVDFEILDFTN
jgi:hypothetical protein